MTSQRRWLFFGLISIGLYLVGMDNSILFTALPSLQEQLHTTENQGLWIINAYPLTMCGLLLGTGTLGDRIGHRRMFLWGLATFGVASLAAAFSPLAWLLVLARGLLGAAAAAMMPATLALIRVTFESERERNTAIGIWGSVFVLGAVSGPLIGGVLLEYFWWGSIFLINVPIAAVTLVATLAVAPPNMPNPAKKWDFLASCLALLTLSGLVMTIEQAVSPHRSVPALIFGLVALPVGAVAFHQRQRALIDPFIDFSLFRNPIFLGGFLGAGISTLLMSGLQLLTSQRFQLVAGFTPFEAGLLAVAMAGSAFPSSILAGVFLDRIGFRTLMAGSFTSFGCGAVICALSLSQPPIFVGGLLLTGLGTGAIASCSSVAIINSAPLNKVGMASSIEEVAYEFGALIAVALFGSLLSQLFAVFAPPGVEITHPLVDAAFHPFDLAYLTIVVILAILAFVTSLICLRLFRARTLEVNVAH
ncbi:MFS transporter [Corynebacterium epidermidicanis]|uniref:Major Facilitator Superfamily transporter n=1 Tax=Corynebacterium epidermidicanis TaxID=1050174 RepID=A0A0G3GTR3_9CORY|nr:MFS transporter [Corynebacterium epidermidicanis]AKK03940.1 Major Facilitator Superfamily transporter [Corynebacterium epidermidicanis]